MKFLNRIHLQDSDKNIIIEKVEEQAQVTINQTVIEVGDIVGIYTHELSEQIDKLKELVQTQSELSQTQSKITELEKKLEGKTNQIHQILHEVEKKDFSKLSKEYQQALEWMLKGEPEKALQLLDENKLYSIEKEQAEKRILKGNVHYIMGQYKEAEENFLQATKIATTYENNLHLGHFYNNTRAYKKAITFYKTAIRLSGNKEEEITSMLSLANCYRNFHKLDLAERQTKKAEEKLRKHITPNPQVMSLDILCELYRGLALMYTEKNDYKESVTYYEKLIDIYTSSIESREGKKTQLEQDLVISLANYGKALQQFQEFQKTGELFRQSYELSKKLIDENPEERYICLYAEVLVNYANYLSAISKREQASHLYQEAVDILSNPQLKLYDIHKPSLVQGYISLALLYSDENKWEEVETHLDKAMPLLVELWKSNPAPYIFKVYMSYNLLGRSCLHQNNYQKAIHCYEQSLYYMEKAENPDIYRKMENLFLKGYYLYIENKDEQGIEDIEKAIQLHRNTPIDPTGIFVTFFPDMITALANIQRKQEKFDQATSILLEAREFCMNPEYNYDYSEQIEAIDDLLFRIEINKSGCIIYE